MRRIFFLFLKLAVAAGIVAAALDVKIPAGTRARIRVYLFDASGSVCVEGNAESLTPQDAWRILRSDAQRFPKVAVFLIAETPNLIFHGPPSELPAAPPGTRPAAFTPLAEALEAGLSLVTQDTDADLVLLGDGRSTGGDLERALLLCSSRGLPVHTVATGPRDPFDVRIAGVRAPAFVDRGRTYALEADLQALQDMEVLVSLAGSFGRREDRVLLVRGRPRTVSFREIPFRAEERLTLEVQPVGRRDACPENNRTERIVLERTDRRRILVLSARSALPPLLAGFAVTTSSSFLDPFLYDVVVLDDFPVESLSPSERNRLRDFVRDFGGGLLVLGGPNAYALGGYARTPVEEALPVWAFPDETLALVLVLDRSGSMAGEAPGTGHRKIDLAKQAVGRVLEGLRRRDLATAIAFSDGAEVLGPLGPDRQGVAAAISRVEAGGPTVVLPALREARALLETTTASRKAILLVTDGATRETPESFRTFQQDLIRRRIGITVVLTGGDAAAGIRSLGTPVPVKDWGRLSALVSELVRESRELTVAPRKPLSPANDHAVLSGIDAWSRPARINRISRKPGSILALACGTHPALVVGTVGRGRGAAAAFALRLGWAGGLPGWPGLSRLLRQLLDWLAPGPVSPYRIGASFQEGSALVFARGPEEGPASLTLEVRPPPPGPARRWRLPRTARTGWEARFPIKEPGTYYLRPEGARGPVASLHIPYPLEYASLGPDEATLSRISKTTGGRRVKGEDDLLAGPKPRWAWRSGRTYWILAALLLLFLDLFLGALWKTPAYGEKIRDKR